MDRVRVAKCEVGAIEIEIAIGFDTTRRDTTRNIAGGNGKRADADRGRYFEIARGSALECAAIQDVLVVGKALDETESQRRKMELDLMAAMLSSLGGRRYQV